MTLLVYHNPKAGHGDVPTDVLVAQLQRAGHEVVWVEKGGDLKLADALAQPVDAVVVVGGDGSVGEVGRKLAGRSIPIGIVPAGTANNIASSLGATAHNLLDLLAGGETSAFDVGWVEGVGKPRGFLEGVGLGAFAETVALLSAHGHDPSISERSEELRRDLQVLSERVRRLEPFECRIEIDGRRVDGTFLMVEVTVGGIVGPNLRLAAGAVPSDGWLDVTLVDAAGRDELGAFVEARLGGAERRPAFTAARAREVIVWVPGGRRLHVDGETVDVHAPAELRIGIEPAALRFFSAPGQRSA